MTVAEIELKVLIHMLLKKHNNRKNKKLKKKSQKRKKVNFGENIFKAYKTDIKTYRILVSIFKV